MAAFKIAVVILALLVAGSVLDALAKIARFRKLSRAEPGSSPPGLQGSRGEADPL
jgi:hypothetical protein